MSNDIIEANAVDAVRQETRLYNSLKPEILEGDTYPSWDGDILVYKPMKEFEERNKGDIIGRIPVQVKGTRVEEFSENECKFDVYTTDMKNFLDDGGAMFFVVEMTNIRDANTTKIFYAEFLQIHRRDILNGKKDQKTIRHTFKELPINKLYLICRNFLLQRKRQGYKIIKWDEGIQYDEYNISIIGEDEDDLDFYLFDQGTYVYGIDEKRNIEIPLHRFIADKKIEKDTFEIGTKDKIYYHNILREITREGKVIKFGKGFTVEIFDNTVKIDFKESGSLRERIIDCSFFYNINKDDCIYLDDNEVKLNINESDRNKRLDDLPKYIKELEDILEVLEILGVEPQEDFDEFRKYEKQLLFLKAVILNKDTKSYKLTDKLFQEVRIGRYRFLLARGSGKHKESLFNFFDYDLTKEKLKVAISPGENFEDHVEHSPYTLLAPDYLYKFSNINIESIERSLLNIEYSEEISLRATNDFLLNSLLFYDNQPTTENKAIIDMVINVYNRITKYDSSVIYFVNKMQAVRRNREFTEAETSEIIGYKTKAEENTSLICAFHILLGNRKEFEFTYNNLTKERQKEISEFPIYNLIKRPIL